MSARTPIGCRHRDGRHHQTRQEVIACNACGVAWLTSEAPPYVPTISEVEEAEAFFADRTYPWGLLHISPDEVRDRRLMY